MTHVVREGNYGVDYLAKKEMKMKVVARWTEIEQDKHLRGLIRAYKFHFIRRRHTDEFD